MKRRKLDQEDADLWSRVAKTTEKLDRRDYFAPISGEEAPAKKPAPKPKPAPFKSFRLGQSATRLPEAIKAPETIHKRLAKDPVSMDAKAFGKMKRGKLVPEGRIDLHGMTLDQAHPALNRFIMTSFSRGLRLVLVITGKGSREDPYDPMPRRRGVLKTQVPLWLKLPPLAQVVLQVTPAHIRHGGEGAYYVYLKRQR